MRQFSLNVPEVMIDESEVPVLADDVAFTIVDGAVLLYQTKAGTSHVLNPTAALIWASVGDDLTVGAIIDELAQTVGVERDTIAKDVRMTLSQFADAGITSTSKAAPNDPTADAPAASKLRQALAARSWSTTIGPVLASAAQVVFQTDDDDVASLVGPVFTALPSGDGSAPSDVVNIAVAVRAGGAPRPFRLYIDGERRSSWSAAPEVLTAIQIELNRIATEEPAGRIILHAGAVERGGDVIVIAGDSGRGKSTLTARMLQRGYAYLTDEVGAIDSASLEVTPYPKQLSLDTAAMELLGVAADGGPGKEHVAAERFGRVSSGGKVRLIVILSEAPPEDPEPMSAGVARMLDMLGCTFLSTFDDLSALDALNELTQRVPIVRLGRSDLDESCDRIEAELRSQYAAPKA